MIDFSNLDLFSVGIAIAWISILGVVVFLNNPRSATNRTFLFLAIIVSLWSFFNYINTQFNSQAQVLWSWRIVLFLAIWYAYTIYLLFNVFPRENYKFTKFHKYVLIPTVCAVSLLSLSPFVFSGIAMLAPVGQVSKTVVGPGIYIFGALAAGLLSTAMYHLYKETKRVAGIERIQFVYVFSGTIITLTLLFIFNFILPGLFLNVRFIPLGAVFTLPFVVATSYAILRHHLFDVKILATEFLSFAIIIVSFLQVLRSETVADRALTILIFVSLLISAILLIRSVRKEVEQREALGVANERLRELDVQKSEFMSLATHQLKAPLTVIKGYASMLKEGSYGAIADGGKEILDRIFGAAQHLVVIIDDFLNISRIEQGRMQYDFGPVDMRQLATGIVNDLKQGAEQKGLQLVFDAPTGTDFTITADFGKIRQVITNLIDNAIKYSTTGLIRVTLLKNTPGGTVRLSVSDTGIGMNAETIEKLFQRFSRAKDVGKTQVGGSGLGLYIAKQMVLAHGGKKLAASGGGGKGGMCFVELPPKPLHEVEQHISPPT